MNDLRISGNELNQLLQTYFGNTHLRIDLDFVEINGEKRVVLPGDVIIIGMKLHTYGGKNE